MSDCLVIAESWGGRLRKATLSAIGAARQARSILGGGFSILVLGRGAAQYAAALVGYGADRVLVCEHPALEHYVAEHYAPTVAAVARNFGLVLAAASSFGKDLVPRV